MNKKYKRISERKLRHCSKREEILKNGVETEGNGNIVTRALSPPDT